MFGYRKIQFCILSDLWISHKQQWAIRKQWTPQTAYIKHACSCHNVGLWSQVAKPHAFVQVLASRCQDPRCLILMRSIINKIKIMLYWYDWNLDVELIQSWVTENWGPYSNRNPHNQSFWVTHCWPIKRIQPQWKVWLCFTFHIWKLHPCFIQSVVHLIRAAAPTVMFWMTNGQLFQSCYRGNQWVSQYSRWCKGHCTMLTSTNLPANERYVLGFCISYYRWLVWIQ